ASLTRRQSYQIVRVPRFMPASSGSTYPERFRGPTHSSSFIAAHRQPRFCPASPAAVHRLHILVSHLLQIFCDQGVPETAPTIQNHLGRRIRHLCFHVPLDHSPAHVHRARQVTPRPFVVSPHVHQQEFLAGVHPFFHTGYICLLDVLLGFVHQFEKI